MVCDWMSPTVVGVLQPDFLDTVALLFLFQNGASVKVLNKSNQQEVIIKAQVPHCCP